MIEPRPSPLKFAWHLVVWFFVGLGIRYALCWFSVKTGSFAQGSRITMSGERYSDFVVDRVLLLAGWIGFCLLTVAASHHRPTEAEKPAVVAPKPRKPRFTFYYTCGLCRHEFTKLANDRETAECPRCGIGDLVPHDVEFSG